MRARNRFCLLPAVLFLAIASGLVAQEEPTSPPGEPAVQAAVDATPAPSVPFDVDAAVEAYLAKQSPEEKARSDAYFEGGYWLQLWGFLYTVGVAWLLLGSGLSARMRDLAERVFRRRPLQTALYTVGYVLVTTLAFFPLTVYQGFFREHQYDLATQTFPQWLRDWAVALGVSAVLLALFFMVLYGVFRKLPRTWWIWGGAVGLVFLMFMLLVGPVYVDPLFNTYTPLEDPAVRDPILSMARANGIEVDHVYQFDASRQTTRVSANVSGFLGTMAIRLNDNLLERCSLAEIREVMAHEIGHYVLNHVYEMLVSFGVVLVGAFAFVRWSFERVRARWGEKWSVSGIGDLAGMPLLVVLLAAYFFVMTPVMNTIIRTNEAEADLFALHAAGEPDGAAEVALKLGEYRKLDPGPLEEWLLFDHPSGRSRIHMAMTWKAENLDG
ncbi:MAG: M48 family metallopeptidase [Acidobacteriota bacterium]|nr:M48 family metallopeptidase [Acidobacteriota bacterium]